MANARILIVEDEAIISIAIKASLTQFGYEVVDIVFSGEEAIIKAQELLPDLIIMDIVLQGEIDGIMAAQKITDSLHIPIVFLTAYTDELTLTRAKITAPYGYIVKPYEDHELYVAIEIALYKRRMELRLQESEERFHNAFEYSAVGMALVENDGNFIQVNSALTTLLGYSKKEFNHLNIRDVSYPDDINLEMNKIKETIKLAQPSFQIEKRYVHKNGHYIWVLLNVSLAKKPETTLPYFIFQLQDITDRKLSEAKLLHLAQYDTLTGLANRSYLEKKYSHIVKLASSKNKTIAILFLDLDNFKYINDTFGHELGDLLLQAVASRLKNRIRSQDLIARLGGDEFIILLNLDSTSNIFSLSKKVLEAFSQPFIIHKEPLNITTSIGISFYPKNGKKISTLLKKSDIALYHAKEKKGNTAEIYSTMKAKKDKKKIFSVKEMKSALKKNEFILYYQPQIDLKTGKIVELEVFVRRCHPKQKILFSKTFISLKEAPELTCLINDWLLKSICLQGQVWKNKKFHSEDMAICLNLSTIQLQDENFLQKLEKHLKEYELKPDYVAFELNNHSLINQTSYYIDLVRKLHKIGVGISINFNTGEYFFRHFKKMSVDKLIIDSYFVNNIANDKNNTHLISAIINLAHQLNIKVVAKGVEAREQFDFFMSHGCDEMQGEYISPPLSAQKISLFLLKRHNFLESLKRQRDKKLT